MLLPFRFLFMLHLLLLFPVLLVMAGVSHGAQISITVMGPGPGSPGCTSLIPSACTGVTQLVSFAPLLPAGCSVRAQPLHLLLPVGRGLAALLIIGLGAGAGARRGVVAYCASSFNFSSRFRD